MAMHRSIIRLAVGTSLTALLMASPAQATGYTQKTRLTVVADRSLSLQEAAGQAQRQFGGKVIKADPVNLQGRHAYRIRMMKPDGRIKEVMLDAASGKPLPRKRK